MPEEDTFYDINGLEISRSNLVQRSIDFYEDKRQAGETRVTDFNEGSEIRNVIESTAVEIYDCMEYANEVTQVAFPDTAEGIWLDKHGSHPYVQLERNQGAEATGLVTFTIPEALSSDVLIGSGTVVVSTENSLQYQTLSDIIISVGDTTATARCECLTVGMDGNCDAGTITVIEDDTIGVNGLTVTNESAFTGGEDYEDDDDYRERLLGHVRNTDFGSLPYYTRLCEEVDGVHDVVFIDDATHTPPFTKICLVNGDVKDTPATVLADVLEVLTIPDNIVIGHTFTTQKPTYVTKNLAVSFDVEGEAYDTDLVKEVVQAFFDGGEVLTGPDLDGLNIGEAIQRRSLYAALEFLDVSNVLVKVNNTEIAEVTTIDEDKVFKLGTVTITQNVIA